MEKEICTLALLGLWAWQDHKKMRINIYTILVAIAVATGIKLVFTGESASGMACGALVGVIILIIAVLSRRAVGPADGLVFIFTGIVLGFWGNMFLVFSSLCLGAFYSMYLLLVKKKGPHYEFAFLPFVLTGYVLLIAVGGL